MKLLPFNKKICFESEKKQKYFKKMTNFFAENDGIFLKKINKKYLKNKPFERDIRRNLDVFYFTP